MCFNLSLNVRREKAQAVFGTDPGRDWGPGFLLSAFDHPVLPVLSAFRNQLQFQEASWGLVPSWAGRERAEELRKHTLNARSEDLWNKPSFRESAVKYRVLIPFTGFFEWKSSPAGPKPFFFRFRETEGLGAFAGLAAPPQGEGQGGWTFTLITGSPNSLVAEVHDRSPIRLFPDQWTTWLDPATGRSDLSPLLQNRDWPDMEFYGVGPLISQRKADRNVPQVIQPGEYPPPSVDGQLGLF